ncbi:metallophosphoesterase family protein [Paenibacillus soyae]|uniref:Metallophosphatase family protein n=1 Tax=Paenibacillus soyae TaxID=2969249 RepID=A0A9X2SDZ1_9BACL|nr:metallophosphoesterase family protein [Paenibacillus soyae]MCR2807622.1 metallophosphatase family protein [Paenibacillus soyae]
MDSPNLIAVISDIHSNSYALEAVLRDIDARGVGRIVNLGDTLFGPIEPIRTAELLMAREDVVHIRGNCDRYLLEDRSESPTFRSVKPLLTGEIEGWLRSFRQTWAYEDLLFCHGAPASDETYLLEEVGPGGVNEKNPDTLMADLADISQSIVFCGHTHVQKSVWLPNGKLIVNAGSVGLPAYEEDEPFYHAMESKTPHAKYVVAARTGGSWRIEHIQVPYDYELAAAQADRNGRPDYSYPLRSGRVKR